MKKLFLLVAVSLLVASCSKEKVQNPTTRFAKVNVHFNDFTITQDDFPSKNGVDPSSYENVGAMTLAFYNAAGTEVYKTTQYKNDGSTYTTFGSFTANLQVGTYTMVALGYAYTDGDVFTLTSPTSAAFTSERPRETFCATQSVTVTSANPLDLNVTLNRIVAALTIQSTDTRPAGIAKIRTTYAKGGKSFNPTTGLATVDAGFSQTNNPSAEIGTTIRVTSFPFLLTDEEDIDITIEVLDDADNVLFTHTQPSVPFKRNRITTLRGPLFSAPTSSASFQLETDWLPGSEITF
jgi:hypothetical protein